MFEVVVDPFNVPLVALHQLALGSPADLAPPCFWFPSRLFLPIRWLHETFFQLLISRSREALPLLIQRGCTKLLFAAYSSTRGAPASPTFPVRRKGPQAKEQHRPTAATALTHLQRMDVSIHRRGPVCLTKCALLGISKDLGSDTRAFGF